MNWQGHYAWAVRKQQCHGLLCSQDAMHSNRSIWHNKRNKCELHRATTTKQQSKHLPNCTGLYQCFPLNIQVLCPGCHCGPHAEIPRYLRSSYFKRKSRSIFSAVRFSGWSSIWIFSKTGQVGKFIFQQGNPGDTYWSIAGIYPFAHICKFIRFNLFEAWFVCVCVCQEEDKKSWNIFWNSEFCVFDDWLTGCQNARMIAW